MIFINGRFLTQPATGVQRFARELLQALDVMILENPAGSIQATCLVPASTPNDHLPRWANIQVARVGKLDGNLWEQVELPWYARKGLLVNLCNIGSLLHTNQLVIFHDASVFAVPSAYSLPFKIKYRIIMHVLGRTARKILTVSQFSRKELARYLHIQEDRMEVIPEGSEHILRAKADNSILVDQGLDKIPYVLAVGSSSAHKNIGRVVEAVQTCSDESLRLAIAGGSFARVFSGVKDFNDERIIKLGYVTDGQLHALYENAFCFVFPSLYEGFGLPPLEAMRCGCPVISSNLASISEVCGDASLYFDPRSTQDIVEKMNTLITDSVLQSKLRQKGLQRADQFTWRITAARMMDVLEGIL